MHSTTFRDAPDFKANPVRAIVRRLLWRLHWKLSPRKPVRVAGWRNGMQILLPNSGAAAPIYYTGSSSPQIAEFMTATLRKGMVVFDIGAHAGEFTLIAAFLAGTSGRVHAFEPQSDLAALVRTNLAQNHLHNAEVHQAAIGAATGEIEFRADSRSLGGWIGVGGTTVQCIALDDFVEKTGAVPDFIKLDAAGAEIGVLKGGSRVISQHSPRMVVQLYHPDVTVERYGYHVGQVIDALAGYNYHMRLIDAPIPGRVAEVKSFADVEPFFESASTYSFSLCATGKPAKS